MKSYERMLLKLNNEINLLQENDKRKVEMIEQYNSELYEILPFLKKPLPVECELDSNYILDEYKEFKADYDKNGYHTFKKYILNIDVIAEIRIKKVKKRGAVVRAEVIKLYKGCISQMKEFDFDVVLSWKPDKWFVKGEVCLVFLASSGLGRYFAGSMKSKMPIIEEKQDRYILCHDCEPEFWGCDGTVPVKPTDQGYSKVNYEDVIRQINEINAGI